MPLPARTPEQAKAQAARRLTAAADRINDAKRESPTATVNAIRTCLLSAAKLNPSGRAPEIINEIADFTLASLRELYLSAVNRDGAP